MTASRKSIIILFLALCAGYMLCWLYAGFMIIYLQTDLGPTMFLLGFTSVLCLLNCYPPLSLSYLFYKQVGNAFSRTGMALSLLFILSFLGIMLNDLALYSFVIQTMLIASVPISAGLSFLVVGFACINKKQKNITRFFGWITLIFLLTIFAIYIFSLGFQYRDFTNRFFSSESIVFWCIGISAPLALLSAVFLGLKEDEQSA